MALLPFGVGQFQNGESVKGFLFLAAEGGALGYGLYIRFKQIPDAEKQFVIDRETEITNKAGEADITAAEASRAKYIKETGNIAMYCFIGTGVVYGIGVIDAFLNLDNGSSRRRADTTPASPPKNFKLAFIPTPQGGLNLNLSIMLE